MNLQILGRWICDVEASSFPSRLSKRVYARDCFEFLSDGKFIRSSDNARGVYKMSRGLLELYIKSFWGLDGRSDAQYFVLSEDKSTLSFTSKNDYVQIYVREESDRGTRLLRAAYGKPKNISLEEFTNVVIEELGRAYPAKHIGPGTATGVDGLNVDLLSFDFYEAISDRLGQSHGGYLVLDLGPKNDRVTEVAEFAARLYGWLATEL